MICDNCGTENLESSSFCKNCKKNFNEPLIDIKEENFPKINEEKTINIIDDENNIEENKTANTKKNNKINSMPQFLKNILMAFGMLNTFPIPYTIFDCYRSYTIALFIFIEITLLFFPSFLKNKLYRTILLIPIVSSLLILLTLILSPLIIIIVELFMLIAEIFY